MENPKSKSERTEQALLERCTETQPPGTVTGINNQASFHAPYLTNTVTVGHDNTVTTTITHITNQATPILRPEREEFNIQECTRSFTGREDILKEMHQDLSLNRLTNTSLGVTSLSIVISGMAGVGKTQMVRKYIELYKTSYDYVIWINAESYTQATSCFNRLASRLSIDIKLNGKRKVSDDILEEVYDFICQKISLIVYDNVESFKTDDGKNGLHLLLPRAIKTGWKVPAIIVTTRNRCWPNFTLRELNGLDSNDTWSLLSVLNIEDSEENRRLVDEVRTLCEGLPLGLQQVVSLIRHKRKIRAALSNNVYTLNDFLDEVKNHSMKLVEREPADQISKDFFTIMNMVFEEISTTKYGKLALHCMYVMGILNPDNIPMILLQRLVTDEDKDLEKVLCFLDDFNLVTRCNGFYQIHRLIQAVTQQSTHTNSSTDDSRREKTIDIVKYFTDFLESMENYSELAQDIIDNAVRLYDYVSPDNHTEAFLDYLQILRCKLKDLGGRNIELKICQHAIETSTKLWGIKHIKTIKNKTWLENALIRIGRYDDAHKSYHDVLQNQIKILGPEHPCTLETKHNLAGVLTSQGNYDEAKQLFQEVLEKLTKILGPEHPSTLTTKHNLAGVLNSKGNYDEAKQLFQEVLEKRIKILGDEHPSTLSTKQNLADVLKSQGNYDEAKQLYKDILKKRIKILGPEHPSTLTSKHNLADVLNSEGNYDEAKHLFQYILEKEIKILGPEHPSTLTTKNNLALVLNRQGNYDEAKQLFQNVLKKLTKILGHEHPSTLTSKHNLADVLNSQGNYDEAKQLFQEVLEKLTKILGHEHPSTLKSKHNLADVLNSQGNYDEAKQLFQEVLEKLTKILGPEHPSTLKSKHNLAGVLNSQGNYDEAKQLFQEVLEKQIKILGAEHPSTLATKHNLAGVLKSQGNYDEAKQLFQEVLVERIKILGPEHPSTLTTKHNLGEVLRSQGNYDEAKQLFQDILEKQIKILGAEHPSTLATKNNLAGVLKSQENYDEAKHLFQEVLEQLIKILGPEHPRTLITKHNLADVLKSQGNYDEAKQLFQEVLDKRIKILGPEHPSTLSTKQNLADVLDRETKCQIL